MYSVISSGSSSGSNDGSSGGSNNILSTLITNIITSAIQDKFIQDRKWLDNNPDLTLHHHQTNPDLPGYSVVEGVEMMRSSVPAQVCVIILYYTIIQYSHKSCHIITHTHTHYHYTHPTPTTTTHTHNPHYHYREHSPTTFFVGYYNVKKVSVHMKLMVVLLWRLSVVVEVVVVVV